MEVGAAGEAPQAGGHQGMVNGGGGERQSEGYPEGKMGSEAGGGAWGAQLKLGVRGGERLGFGGWGKVWPLPGLGECVEVGVRLRTWPVSECEVPGWGAERKAPLRFEVSPRKHQH